MTLLALLLECAALLGATATGVALAVVLTTVALRPLLARLSAAIRADFLFVAAALPGIAAVAATVAVLTPSLLALVGLGLDHCESHGHHAHLCLVHAQTARPALMAVGAICLAVILFRMASVVGKAVADARRLKQLEALGQKRELSGFPLFSIRGAPGLCHSAGLLRGRVLISSELAATLPAAELEAALAHEAAHLRRRDPLMRFALRILTTVVLPPLARVLQDQHEHACELACDAEAVKGGHHGPVVASALINVARWTVASRAVPGASAFGENELEQRVDALMNQPVSGPRLPGIAVTAALLTVGALPVLHAASVHHAAETVLNLLF